jgi:outer membrane receptor protein involved in Fe transport
MQTNLRRIGLFLLVVFWPAPVSAQQPAPASGRIVGRVLDSATGAGLPAVAIEIVGTSVDAVSGLNGRFIVNNVPAGRVTMRASLIGFGTRTVADIEVPAGATTEQNVALETQAVALEAVEITALAERGSVNRALDQQRNATGIVNAVTAEQISRSPDGDAAQAVQRVSGVTVQDGKFVTVRGLGERYTTTSLNGARIPSAEPERKLVPLDLFPTALLEQITTSKTFTPDQPGDFSGAQVDIKTRDFPVKPEQSYSFSIGYNTAITGKNIPTATSTGRDWLAFGAGARALPPLLRAAGNFSETQASSNMLIGSLRNAWSTVPATAAPNGSLGFVFGGSKPVGNRHYGYLLSGTYSATGEIRADEVRARALSAESGTTEVDRYEGNTTRSSVLWGGVANLSALFDGRSRIALNNTYNRSADNEARFELGNSENYGNLPLHITRLRYVERTVRSHQLIGEHAIGERQTFNWSITSSAVSRLEPDRSEIVYAVDSDPATGTTLPPAWFASAAEGAVRTFGDLAEGAWEFASSLRRAFGSRDQHQLKIGALARFTNRDAENFAYSITAPLMEREARELPPEQIFANIAAQPQHLFRIAPMAQGGSYRVTDELFAGYGMMTWTVSEHADVTLGARVEHSSVRVEAEPTIGAMVISQPSFTDVLPSFAITFRPTHRQNIRLSASQTLSRPEYRELAGIQYREVLGGDNVLGNPALRRTLIRNIDARYELYPSANEVLSVALFAKFFRDPIERVYLGTSGTSVVSFMNAESARNYGIELEARKQFGKLTAFSNITLMQSEITIGGSESNASRINDERAMVGQSPYVINAGLMYAPGQFSATVLYNVFGKRIVSAAEMPLPDVYERARHSVDVSLRLPLTNGLFARVDVKNALDHPYHITQGSTTREFYKSGRVISTGFTWRP